jgi:hypothetical protein
MAYVRWVPVVGYEGMYEVSSEGGVRRISSRVADGRAWPGRVLQPSYTRGYARVKFCRQGQTKNYSVHILVLLAFRGPCPTGMQACHRNDQPGDNRLSNLRWDTPRENWLDRVRLGTARNIGEGCHKAKLRNAQVRWLKRLLKKWPRPTYAVLAARLGVSRNTIANIAQGRSWRFVE